MDWKHTVLLGPFSSDCRLVILVPLAERRLLFIPADDVREHCPAHMSLLCLTLLVLLDPVTCVDVFLEA